jgi:hypothetical protein
MVAMPAMMRRTNVAAVHVRHRLLLLEVGAAVPQAVAQPIRPETTMMRMGRKWMMIKEWKWGAKIGRIKEKNGWGNFGIIWGWIPHQFIFNKLILAPIYYVIFSHIYQKLINVRTFASNPNYQSINPR